jgi:hypothetical protein
MVEIITESIQGKLDENQRISATGGVEDEQRDGKVQSSISFLFS